MKIILGGRYSITSLSDGIRSDIPVKSEELKRFNEDEILEYLTLRGNSPVGLTPERLTKTKKVTHGNPLWLSFLDQIIRSDFTEWNWDELETIDMSSDMSEKKLNYLIERVARNIQGGVKLLSRLALPLELTKDVLEILFSGVELKTSELLSEYINKGILYKGKDKDRNSYFLHREVRDVLNIEREKEYGTEETRYYENEEIIAIHTRLFESYDKKIKDKDSKDKYISEKHHSSYYSFLKSKNFIENCKKAGTDVLYLWDLISSSTRIDDTYIKEIADTKANELSEEQIKKLVSIFQDERRKLNELNIPEELIIEIPKFRAKGISIDFKNNLFIIELIKIAKEKRLESVAFYLEAIFLTEDNETKTVLFTKAIELDPKDAKAYNNRGTAYGNLKNFPKAIDDFTKAIELDPKDATAYYNRGSVYDNIKDYPKAIDDYSKGIELDSKNAKAYCNRGIAYSALGQQEKAIEDFDSAIKLNPYDGSPYYNKGCAFSLMKNKAEALHNLKKSIELDGNYNNMAQEDNDFESLWNDEDFLKVVL